MTLWLFLAAITALALVLMLRPLLWGPRGGATREALETAFYRDRLSEVKRDLERGLLSPAEAEAAETEIARRMLIDAFVAEIVDTLTAEALREHVAERLSDKLRRGSAP